MNPKDKKRGRAPTVSRETHQAALKAMAGWVTTIAHNVKNPVAGIAAAIEIIERELAKSDSTGAVNAKLVDDSLRRVKERLRLLTEYVTELVDFSKPAQAQPEPIDTKAAFAALTEDGLVPPNVRLVTDIGRGAERLSADPQRLRIALKSLLLNGVEAAIRDPRPCVLVQAKPMTKDGQKGVLLTVEDNGAGFEDEELHRVSEPFFSTKEAGTGLGLAIVRKIADAHGGHVEFGASQGLGGARVSLFLPYREDPTPVSVNPVTVKE